MRGGTDAKATQTNECSSRSPILRFLARLLRFYCISSLLRGNHFMQQLFRVSEALRIGSGDRVEQWHARGRSRIKREKKKAKSFRCQEGTASSNTGAAMSRRNMEGRSIGNLASPVVWIMRFAVIPQLFEAPRETTSDGMFWLFSILFGIYVIRLWRGRKWYRDAPGF